MENKTFKILIGLFIGIILYTKVGIAFYLLFLGILFSVIFLKKENHQLYFFIGTLLLSFFIILNHENYNYKVGEQLYISGEVREVISSHDNYQRIEVHTKDKGNFSLGVLGMDEIRQYDIVTGEIVIEEIVGNYNFNMPSREDYFFLKNIDYNGKAIYLEHSKNPSIIKNFKISFVEKINLIIDNNFSRENSGLVKKLILSDNKDLEKETSELYRDSGLAHLLAISGLHIFIIIWILDRILIQIKFGYNLRFIAISLILFFYIFILNYPPSASRAILMYLLRGVFAINKIKASPKTVIYLSAIILLSIFPKWIFDIGFQLTYMAILGIVYLNERVTFSRKSYIEKSVYLYIFVNLFIFPLLVIYFNNYSPLSIANNILITPVFIFVLVGTLIGISLNLIFGLGNSIFYFLNSILTWISDYLNLSLNLIDFRIAVFQPNILFVIGYYTILLLILYKPFKNYFYYNRKVIYTSFTLIILFISLLSLRNPLYVGFLDVGQGDSSYLLYKDLYIQIDTGGSHFSSYNPGEEVTVKSIKKRGINNVDILILSHFDEDHIGGTKKLLKDGLIENVIINRKEENDETFRALQQSAVKIFYPDKGSKLVIDKDLNIEFFNTNPGSFVESNDSSLVVLINYKNKKILYTGDSSSSIEEKFAREIGSVDILKVSHHGSEYSTSEKFLKSSYPKYSVISAGKNNPYGHPSSKVLNNLSNVNSKVFRTDLDGEILFRIDQEIEYKTYRNQRIFRIHREILFFSVIIIFASFFQINKNEGKYEIRRF